MDSLLEWEEATLTFGRGPFARRAACDPPRRAVGRGWEGQDPAAAREDGYHSVRNHSQLTKREHARPEQSTLTAPY